MAYSDYEEDLYDDDDLDEEERAERREDRRYYREAMERALGMAKQVQEQKINEAFIPGDLYMATQEKETVWAVENFIPCGSLVILGGNSKSGKTCLATALAMAMANNEPFLGFNTRHSPILWCAFEESREERKALLSRYPELPTHFYTSHPRFKIESEYGLKVLTKWANMHEGHPPLIVIDPLFGATDENLSEGRAARNALMGLKRLAADRNATILVIHHVNKDVSAGNVRERFAESNQILATASMDILMDSTDKADGTREIRLQCRGRGDHANRTLLVRSTGATEFELIGFGDNSSSKTKTKIDAILLELSRSESPMTTELLAEACKLEVQTLRNLIVPLVKAGELVVAGMQGKQKLYALPAHFS